MHSHLLTLVHEGREGGAQVLHDHPAVGTVVVVWRQVVRRLQRHVMQHKRRHNAVHRTNAQLVHVLCACHANNTLISMLVPNITKPTILTKFLHKQVLLFFYIYYKVISIMWLKNHQIYIALHFINSLHSHETYGIEVYGRRSVLTE